jgi:uncharacterized protein with FMN-binding domain
MRRAITVLALAVVLSVPILDAAAAANAATRKIVATKTFNGPTVSVSRWGELSVTIKVRKTTTVTNGKKKVAHRIVAVRVPVYPNHTDRSVYINSQAIPLLRSATLQKQSANIGYVSGATDTSDSYETSLQAAILKARHW